MPVRIPGMICASTSYVTMSSKEWKRAHVCWLILFAVCCLAPLHWTMVCCRHGQERLACASRSLGCWSSEESKLAVGRLNGASQATGGSKKQADRQVVSSSASRLGGGGGTVCFPIAHRTHRPTRDKPYRVRRLARCARLLPTPTLLARFSFCRLAERRTATPRRRRYSKTRRDGWENGSSTDQAIWAL